MADDDADARVMSSPQHTRAGASYGAATPGALHDPASPQEAAVQAAAAQGAPAAAGEEAAAVGPLQGQAAQQGLPAHLAGVIAALHHAPPEERERALLALLASEAGRAAAAETALSSTGSGSAPDPARGAAPQQSLSSPPAPARPIAEEIEDLIAKALDDSASSIAQTRQLQKQVDSYGSLLSAADAADASSDWHYTVPDTADNVGRLPKELATLNKGGWFSLKGHEDLQKEDAFLQLQKDIDISLRKAGIEILGKCKEWKEFVLEKRKEASGQVRESLKSEINELYSGSEIDASEVAVHLRTALSKYDAQAKERLNASEVKRRAKEIKKAKDAALISEAELEVRAIADPTTFATVVEKKSEETARSAVTLSEQLMLKTITAIQKGDGGLTGDAHASPEEILSCYRLEAEKAEADAEAALSDEERLKRLRKQQADSSAALKAFEQEKQGSKKKVSFAKDNSDSKKSKNGEPPPKTQASGKDNSAADGRKAGNARKKKRGGRGGRK